MRRLAVLVLVALAGCSGVDEGTKVESSPSAPTDQPAAVETTTAPTRANVVGDKVALRNGDTVQVYSYNSGITSGNQFLRPKAGMQYVAIDVEGCAKAASPFGTVNPFSFHLAMPDNTRLQSGVPAKEPALNSGAQAPGDCIRGWVTFEVPTGAKPAAVIFDELGTSVKWAIP